MQPNYARESPAFEKLRDVSPNRIVALDVLRSGEPAPHNIDSDVIAAADLVSVPSKTSNFQIT
jgi:hypothetical protein